MIKLPEQARLENPNQFTPADDGCDHPCGIHPHSFTINVIIFINIIDLGGGVAGYHMGYHECPTDNSGVQLEAKFLVL